MRDVATALDSATFISVAYEELTQKEEQSSLRERYVRLADSDVFEPTLEDLIALSPLPNNCAHRIARAYDIYAQFKRSVKDPYVLVWFRVASRDARERVINQWRAQLKDAADLLLVASEQCIQAAHLGAPPPSIEELLNVYIS